MAMHHVIDPQWADDKRSVSVGRAAGRLSLGLADFATELIQRSLDHVCEIARWAADRVLRVDERSANKLTVDGSKSLGAGRSCHAST